MNEYININLGSGPDGLENWINFDWGWLPFVSKYRYFLKILVSLNILDGRYLKKWNDTKLYDLRKGIPCPDNYADWIYSSHFLEHLEKYEVDRLLKECWRVLKNRGKIRIVLPNIDRVIDNYIKSNNSDLFCREFYGYDKDLIKNSFGIRGHQWMYNPDSVINLLKKAGFKNVKLSDFRTSDMPDVLKLDLEIHRKLSMYIEAEKS